MTALRRMTRVPARLTVSGLVALTVLVAGITGGVGGPVTPAATAVDHEPYYAGTYDVGFDVSHYVIRIRTAPRRRSITATTTIAATAARPLRTIRLDFRGLVIDGVEVDGRPTRHRRSGGVLRITPRTPIAADAEFRVAVRYHGVPRPVADPTAAEDEAGAVLGWQRTRHGDVYVVSEPTGARGWFPGHDFPADKATFAISVHAPTRLAVASNGTLTPGRSDGSGRWWHWRMDQPMATYLATVVIAPMREHRDRSPAGVPLRSYFPLESFERTVSNFERTGEMVDFFAERFGPYPFDAYGAVTIREPLGYALETQTMSIFGADMLGRDTAAQLVVAHELAHQWFGNSVGIRRWADIWLNEAFANYSQYLWLEHARPTFDLDRYMQELRTRELDALTPIGDPGRRDTFGFAVYERGALMMHAFRRTVGDEAYFATMKAWTAAHRHSTATPAEFVALAGEISGRPLEDFFDRWLDATEVPALPR